MTTPINLDRRIQAIVERVGPGYSTYTYNGTGFGDYGGRWDYYAGGTQIRVGYVDSNDLVFPQGEDAVMSGIAVDVDGVDLGEIEITAVEAQEAIYNLTVRYIFTYTPANRIVNGTVLTLQFPTGGTTTVQQQVEVWAARRDFTASDQLRSGISGEVVIQDARFYVRDHPGIQWEAGDTLVDDEGRTRNIVGVAKDVRGRGRYVELQARLIGA